MTTAKSDFKNGVATMSDVAALAGVSRSTVSRVLSQRSTDVVISEETTRRVHEAAAQLGYRPNLTARSLRTQKTYLLAIMIADISNPFYHTIVRKVQDIARRHGYDVIIANTDQQYDYEAHFCEAILRRPVDGVIMVPFHLKTDALDALMQQTDTKIVALGQQVQHPLIDVVYADDERATFEAMLWLMRDKGHARVGFIGVPPSYPPGIRRWNGFMRAAAAAGLPIHPEFVDTGDFTRESGYAAMTRLLQQPERPTAIFACNDNMAIGAMLAAQDSGLRIPDDLAIIGFDNIPEGELMRPRLSTIAQFPEEIGKKLAEALFERIENPALEAAPRRLYEIPCRLIARGST
jgi:LacI family transcriptional regulator